MTGITVNFTIRRMCASRHEGDNIVLTVGICGVSRAYIQAYSMTSGELKWQFWGGVPGYATIIVDEIFTDQNGNIRLCSYVGREVLRLSVHGQFLGNTPMDSCFGNVRKQRLRDPRIVHRCITTSNVIVADKKNGQTWQINILNE